MLLFERNFQRKMEEDYSNSDGMKTGNGHSGRVAETNAITIYIAFYLVQFLS